MISDDNIKNTDILNVDEDTEMKEPAPYQCIPYDPGFEDITDEDDDIIPDVLSLYPLDQCSRTSPGNHSTIRRWKQRSSKKRPTYDLMAIKKHSQYNMTGLDPDMTGLDLPDTKSSSSDQETDMKPSHDLISDMTASHSSASDMTTSVDWRDHDRASPNSAAHDQSSSITTSHNLTNIMTASKGHRSQSAVGFSPLCIETGHNDNSSGPFSAPCSVRWRQQSLQSSISPASSPGPNLYQSSTPVNYKKPKFPFNISSIVGTPTTKAKERSTDNVLQVESAGEKQRNSQTNHHWKTSEYPLSSLRLPSPSQLSSPNTSAPSFHPILPPTQLPPDPLSPPTVPSPPYVPWWTSQAAPHPLIHQPYLQSDYLLHLQQQLLALHYQQSQLTHQQPHTSQENLLLNIPPTQHAHPQYVPSVRENSTLDTSQSDQDKRGINQEKIVNNQTDLQNTFFDITNKSVTSNDSGLEVSTESYNTEDSNSNILQSNNLENGEFVIDVECCDDDPEQIVTAIETNSEDKETNDLINSAEDNTIMENSNQINKNSPEGRTMNNNVDVDVSLDMTFGKSQTSALVTSENHSGHNDKVHDTKVYNPKKKMFEVWKKMGVLSNDMTKPAKNVNDFNNSKAVVTSDTVEKENESKQITCSKVIRNEEEFTEYKHKKIRRESKETTDVDITTDLLEYKKTGYDRKDHQLEIKKKYKFGFGIMKEKYQLKSHCDINQNKETKTLQTKFKGQKKPKLTKKTNKVKKNNVSKWKTSPLEKLPTGQVTRRQDIPRYLPDQIPSCTLSEVDLLDGLRILTKIGCHFYPGRLTEVSPPDIYGIVIDKERGNKPHIFSREDVIKEAILEMRPRNVAELELGSRVCAYWSSKMNYLHPGTVAGPDIDEDYVIIQLDDGDSRDIHIDQVRYLPENYPLVDTNVDSATEFFGSRKRSYSVIDKVQRPFTDKTVKPKPSSKKTKNTFRQQSKKSKNKGNSWSVVVTEVIDSVENYRNVSESALDNISGEVFSERDDDQDSAFESDEHRDDSDLDDDDPVKYPPRRISDAGRSAIASFLPPQHLLWSWSDEGRKLSAKARKVYHDSIEKDDDTIRVGDCAVFLSTGRPDRPYIGRIHSMWQTSAGNKKVQVNWFYHPAEVEGTAVGGGRVEDIKTKGGLFSSSHYDENDVQTISHKCEVRQFADFTRLISSSGPDMDNNDMHYLAGEYDPVEGTIVFTQGVLG
eukprot:GFUD01006573.1.p1 GENE.GFUD01006573.1~~GFUD01006573.1.p1  ORF type:complete len:1213 (-),score=321.37 GFUD01006573.1:383-4021(-)